MKRTKKMLSLALIAITIICLFLPIATFQENASGALAGDITKQQDKLDRANAKLERDTKAGKDADTLAKDQAKVDKEQAALDELIAQSEAAANNTGGGLRYALLPGKLPAELELDMQLINSYKLYEANFSGFYMCIWAVLGLLALTFLLELAAGDKIVSKNYTFASFTNLAAIILIVYTLLRLGAFPIKAPYSGAIINPVIACLLVVLPIVVLGINLSNVFNSKRSMIYVLCAFLCFLSIVPFWIMIVNSTRSSQQIQQGVSLLPSKYFLYNWQVLQSKNFDLMTGFRNSAIIAFGSTILSVYFSALTAYGITVYNFKGRKLAIAVILGILMIPTQVTATGFYIFMYQLGWVNSYLPLIIPSIAAASTVYFFKQYLEANFQIALVEAARIDGAGEFKIFNSIIMPIMVPAMATMGIMAVIGSWNNYLTPLMLLTNPNMKTLPMMVKELRGDIYRTEFGSIYLGLTMTALPLIIVYFAFSKYIIAGIAVGGVKE